MNKNMKKLRSRMVQTIQDNYSIRNSQEKNNSLSNKQKFKTLLSQKIQTFKSNKPSRSKKRVYLNTVNQSTLYPNLTLICTEKEGITPVLIQESQHRYINRVKSSNAPNLDNWSQAKDSTMRKTVKTKKMLKNLSQVQFESELYWNGSSSYLVTGVKNQYEKIKKNYEQKCLEIEKIKKQFKVNTTKQLKIYTEKLQKQNLKSIEALTKYRSKLTKENEVMPNLQNLILQNYPPKQPQEIEKEYELKIEKLQQKIQSLKKKNNNLTQENKKLSTKIFLQQKMIIQKDNLQFKIETRSKKVQKQINQLRSNLKKNQQKAKEDLLNAEQKLNELKLRLKEQYGLEIKNLHDSIRQKDNKNQKIQKQISHLKSLLQHWKHGDFSQLEEQTDQIIETNQEKQQKKLQNIQVSKICLETNLKSHSEDKHKQKITDKIKLNFKNSIQNDLPLKKDSNSNGQQSQRSINRSMMKRRTHDGKNTGRSTQKTIKRQRITAKTHKSDSIRCRPVEINQVQPIIEYLKLKLAFKRINLSDIKTLFQYPKPIETSQDENFDRQNQELLWEQQYISLKEVYDIFLKQPFNIRESQALLLSRFIIEDVKEPYVYMNWDSENSRRMVESIIYSLLTFTQIHDDTIQKSEDLLKKYETVVIPALKSVTGRTGKISKDKFIEILNGLGLQRTKFMDDYIIGKMCIYSQSLDELIFSSLYDKQEINSSNRMQ